jgi:hypothetical protein
MTAAERFVAYPLSFVHAGGTLSLLQLHVCDLSPQARINRVFSSGSVDPQAHILHQADPVLNVETYDLATLFAALTPTTCLKAIGDITARYQQRDDGGGIFATGTSHITEVFAGGVMCCTGLSVSQDDEEGMAAQLSIGAIASDGLTYPITTTVNADFTSAPAVTFGSKFYMGPVYHNSAALPAMTQWGIDFGVRMQFDKTSGAVYPTLAYLTKREPVITFTGKKLSADAAANKLIRAQSGAFAFYALRGSDGGARVSLASSVHLKVSVSSTNGVWNVQRMAARGTDDGMVTYQAMPKGANVSVSVVSAVP